MDSDWKAVDRMAVVGIGSELGYRSFVQQRFYPLQLHRVALA
jgi:hypothetical protein